jgi:hypothetical protein
MAIATGVIGAVGAAAPYISAGATAYNSYLQWDAAQDANSDAKKLKKLKETQAEDIIGQIEAEDLLYEDDLQMIQKQTALAEDKLLMQTASAFEQTGDTLANVVAGTYGGKYESGAGRKVARKARAAMKEEGVDLLESFEMGQKEVALQNEEAERQAEIRKDEIIGSLEATYMELTGNEIPDATTTTTTNPPSQEGMSDEEIDDLYDEQAAADYY